MAEDYYSLGTVALNLRNNSGGSEAPPVTKSLIMSSLGEGPSASSAHSGEFQSFFKQTREDGITEAELRENVFLHSHAKTISRIPAKVIDSYMTVQR